MYNQVTLLGRLGKDVEIREFQNSKVANCSLATTESWKDKSGEWQEATEWHRLVGWNSIADRMSKLAKGDLVFVVGKIKSEQYEDRDGNKREAFKIHVETIRKANAGKSVAPQPAEHDPLEDDQPPF